MAFEAIEQENRRRAELAGAVSAQGGGNGPKSPLLIRVLPFIPERDNTWFKELETQGLHGSYIGGLGAMFTTKQGDKLQQFFQNVHRQMQELARTVQIGAPGQVGDPFAGSGTSRPQGPGTSGPGGTSLN